MAAITAAALASPRGQDSDRYYFVVDLERSRGDSLGLVLSARPDGFLVEEIVYGDGTGADTLIGVWNKACAATCPRAMVQTGDVVVKVNDEGVSDLQGADCCNDLCRQLTMCQCLLLLVRRPHDERPSLLQRLSPMVRQDPPV